MSVKIDPHTRTWLNIKAYIDERCAHLSLRNDGLSLSWEETQQSRARLSELKLLLSAVAVEEPTLVSEDFEPYN